MSRPFLVLALLVVACGEARPPVRNPSDESTPVGDSTLTTPAQCATAGLSGLTYSNFGQAFMATYCIRCHGANVTGVDRQGAPTDHNFDTYAGIQQFRDHIDQVAGMNPAPGGQKNFAMPINGLIPPDPERQKLACWIATGLAP
jgi:cytochrome c5